MTIYALALLMLVVSRLSGMEEERKSEGPESNDLVFFDNSEDASTAIDQKKFLPRSDYQYAVHHLSISCVDIFIYNPHTKEYFLVVRNNKPAEGILWYPGGRQVIFETFFEAARRKSKEEMALEILPIVHLGHYGTQFGDSQYESPTHTNNQVVFAILEPGSTEKLDENHENAQWVPLGTPPVSAEIFGYHPEHLYLYEIWLSALEAINDHERLIHQLMNSEEERVAYRSRRENSNAHQDTLARYDRIYNLHNAPDIFPQSANAQRLWATITSFSPPGMISAIERLLDLFTANKLAERSLAYTLSSEAKRISTLWSLIDPHERSAVRTDLERLMSDFHSTNETVSLEVRSLLQSHHVERLDDEAYCDFLL